MLFVWISFKLRKPSAITIQLVKNEAFSGITTSHSSSVNILSFLEPGSGFGICSTDQDPKTDFQNIMVIRQNILLPSFSGRSQTPFFWKNSNSIFLEEFKLRFSGRIQTPFFWKNSNSIFLDDLIFSIENPLFSDEDCCDRVGKPPAFLEKNRVSDGQRFPTQEMCRTVGGKHRCQITLSGLQ